MPIARRVFIVLVLWSAGLCAAAQFAKVVVALPELVMRFPDAGPAVGFLVSSISIVGALLGLVAGMLSIRYGERRLLLFGLVLGSLVALSQVVELPLGALLFSRLVEGISHLAIVVSAPILIATFSGGQFQAVAMTLWGTFFGVAFALTAWLGMPLVEAQGVPALFLAHAGITLVVTILVAIAVPSPVPTSVPVSTMTSESLIQLDSSSLLRRHVLAWSSPFVAAPAAGWLFYTVTFVAMLAVLPSLMPPEERVFAATALPLVSIVSSLSIGVLLLSRFSAVTVIRIGFLAALIATVCLAVTSAAFLPCLFLFASLGLVQGASFAAIPQLNASSDDRSLASGALSQSGNIGNSCGTPLLLAVLAIGGIETMLLVVVACYAAGLVVHSVHARQRRRSLDLRL